MKKITDIEKLNIEKKFIESSNNFFPEEPLKQRIVGDIKVVSNIKHKKIKTFMPRLAVACAAVLIVLVLGGIGLHNENYMSLYIDVNPSVELSVNRFDIVNGVNYINADAEQCFKDLSIIGKTSQKAVESIIDTLSAKNYLNDNAEMYLSGFSSKRADIAKKLEKIKEQAENYKKNNNSYSVVVGRTDFNEKDNNTAKNHGLTPAKYKIITEIIALDSSYTIEILKDKSIRELKLIFKELGNDNSAGQHQNRGNSR